MAKAWQRRLCVQLNRRIIMGTFIVGAILVIVVGLIIRKIIKDKKKGSGCDGNCSNCGCH